ncbi:helix-turn-helix transcriptional regulator [Actinoplanes sp. M2I2]|uniref:helix-turn-helix domain-containing protein n=1 Tax=Actinoplanes sp. M2I2 TaxID=1734444 RepID=UPI002021C620|nr:helix-turn-helix transcriptional regulator [Actinoplanes sp. M2I2]
MNGSLGDSPAVARHKVRRRLRQARLTLGLTQGEVAQRLGWSLSKVQRIEAAEVAVSETDLRALLAIYDITAQPVVDELVTDAYLARRERWWTPPEHRQYLTYGTRQLIQFELAATHIRAYQPNLVPGLLQTPAMADYIINESGSERTPENRRVILDVRLMRRKTVLERQEPPIYQLILDESAIERIIGGARVMAEQLEDLADVATRPNVLIRLMPLHKGAFVADLGSFALLTLDGDTEDSVLYREQFDEDSIEYDPAKTGRYGAVFEQVWNQSYREDASLRRITAKAASLRASLDTP